MTAQHIAHRRDAAEDALLTTPAHDVEAELSLLAARVGDAAAAQRMIAKAGGVCASDFYIGTHKRIAEALDRIEARGGTGDAVTIRGEIRPREEDAYGAIEAAIASVLSLAPDINPANALFYAQRVRALAQAREMRRASLAIVDALRRGDDSALAVAEAEMAGVRAMFAPKTAEQAYAWATSAELLAEPEPPFDWLWSPILARDCMTLIAAAPKCGKTWILFALLGALSRGEPWLGRPPLGRVPRVLLVSEEPRRIVRRRLRQFGVTNVDILTLEAMKPGATWEELVAEAGRRAAEVGAELVIFDTVSTLAGIEDENNPPQVNAALLPTVKLARTSGVAVSVVHHCGKDGSIRGCTAWTAVPDCIVEIAVDGGKRSYRRSLSVGGRLPDKPDAPILVEFVRGEDGQPDGYRLVGGQAVDEKAEQARARLARLDGSIVDLLAKAGASWCEHNEAVTKAIEAHDEPAILRLAGVTVPYPWLRRERIAEATTNEARERVATLAGADRIARVRAPGQGGAWLYAAVGTPSPDDIEKANRRLLEAVEKAERARSDTFPTPSAESTQQQGDTEPVGKSSGRGRRTPRNRPQTTAQPEVTTDHAKSSGSRREVVGANNPEAAEKSSGGEGGTMYPSEPDNFGTGASEGGGA